MKKILLGIFVLLAAGCVNQDMQDLRSYVVQIKARAPQPIDPIPQIRQSESYLYVAGGRRDPFARSGGPTVIALTGASDGPTPNFNRRREELEQHPLDTLKLVGSMEQKEMFWGLIRTKQGTIHRIKEGNFMGHNFGLITSVREDQIILRELVQDGRGGYVERKASLSLAAK
jgi:type IV pilus assembly protein PilP